MGPWHECGAQMYIPQKVYSSPSQEINKNSFGASKSLGPPADGSTRSQYQFWEWAHKAWSTFGPYSAHILFLCDGLLRTVFALSKGRRKRRRTRRRGRRKRRESDFMSVCDLQGLKYSSLPPTHGFVSHGFSYPRWITVWKQMILLKCSECQCQPNVYVIHPTLSHH